MNDLKLRRHLYRIYTRLVFGVLAMVFFSYLIARNGNPFSPLYTPLSLFCIGALFCVWQVSYWTFDILPLFFARMLLVLCMVLWVLIFSPIFGDSIWTDIGGVTQGPMVLRLVVDAAVVSLGFAGAVLPFAAICYFSTVSWKQSVATRGLSLVAYGLLVGLLVGTSMKGIGGIVAFLAFALYALLTFFVSARILADYQPEITDEEMKPLLTQASFFHLNVFFFLSYLSLRSIFLLFALRDLF